jgi:hypothetical protein
VEGVGCRVIPLRVRRQDVGVALPHPEVVVPCGLGFGVYGFGCRVWGLGFRVQGLGFRV